MKGIKCAVALAQNNLDSGETVDGGLIGWLRESCVYNQIQSYFRAHHDRNYFDAEDKPCLIFINDYFHVLILNALLSTNCYLSF